MFKTTLTAAILAAVTATSAFATGMVELTEENIATITEMLTAEGHEVGKIKLEDGMYEAYTKKDGEKLEVFLDADFNIVKIED